MENNVVPVEKAFNLDDMVPSQIVRELNKYVIGQDKAKRTIAVAIRNRTRRKRLPDNIRDEVYPKNIIMIGPTGVGKTEIARRIARLSNAPFIKVEATKFTEVGYVGRDVESMIKDLMGSAVSMVRRELAAKNEEKVKAVVEERLIDLLIPSMNKNGSSDAQFDEAGRQARELVREKLRKGEFENTEVEVNVSFRPKSVEIGMVGSMDDFQNAMNNIGNISRAPRTAARNTRSQSRGQGKSSRKRRWTAILTRRKLLILPRKEPNRWALSSLTR